MVVEMRHAVAARFAVVRVRRPPDVARRAVAVPPLPTCGAPACATGLGTFCTTCATQHQDQQWHYTAARARTFVEARPHRLKHNPPVLAPADVCNQHRGACRRRLCDGVQLREQRVGVGLRGYNTRIAEVSEGKQRKAQQRERDLGRGPPPVQGAQGEERARGGQERDANCNACVCCNMLGRRSPWNASRALPRWCVPQVLLWCDVYRGTWQDPEVC